MQRIFKTDGNISKFLIEGRNYNFPKEPNEKCHNCSIYVTFKKHGFYIRYFVSRYGNKYVEIRRYICPRCGCTISFIPDFILFRRSMSSIDVFLVISKALNKTSTLNSCIIKINSQYKYLELSRQLLYQYIKRYLQNLPIFEQLIRNISSDILLPDNNLSNKERGRDIINLILSKDKLPRISLTEIILIDIHTTPLAKYSIIKRNKNQKK